DAHKEVSMKRWFGGLLAALTLALGVTVVAASPASAAATCPSKTLCVWDGQNFTGEKREFSAWSKECHPQLGWFLDDSFNNRTESMLNTSGNYIYVYDNSWCTGDAIGTYNGGSLSSLGWMNNRGTSFLAT